MRLINEGCTHIPRAIGEVTVVACASCRTLDWFSSDGALDPAEGMARLFGSYDLVDHLDALGAPSPTVLVYRPPNAKKRRHLDLLPEKTWLQIGPDLWLSHNGELLELATNHQLLLENLTRGA